MVSESLLFGLLALQNDFITREQLLDTFARWTKQPTADLKQLLVAGGHLSLQDHNLLLPLVERFNRKFKSVEESIASLSSVSSVADQLLDVAEQAKLDKTHFTESLYATFNSLATIATGANASLVLSGGTGDNRFRIVREVARGGLGVVFVAQDQQLRREVAVKRIREEKADDAILRQKFQREAEVTGQLEHPGIVPIYALGADANGQPYYAMRFIRGESLNDSIHAFHRKLNAKEIVFDSPELRQLLRRFIDVCNAIAYAHERGVLHRDLKPGNIMLGKHGETLVVDWGLAKPMPTSRVSTSESPASDEQETRIQSDAGDSETRHGCFLGTIAYAPPEQLRGEIDRLAPVSDVYSLGAILYQLLAGTPPIAGGRTIENALQQIEDLQTRNLHTLRKDIPKPLAFICNRALRSRLEDRYVSVNELRDDVQRWLDDQAIVAMKEPWSATAGRWIRRHQAISSSVGVGSMIAMVLLGVLFIREQNSSVKERALRFDAEQANLRLQQSNMDLLLSSANLARRRGQYREAAQTMRDLQSQSKLTSSQRLVFVRDLYFSEDIRAAIAEAEALDRDLLEEDEKSQFDLLFGDMLLMTKQDDRGLDLIQQAITSQRLSISDHAYANALLAKTPADSIRFYGECLESDAYNSNALARRGISCAIAGRMNQALADARLGQQLFPEDIRFDFLRATILAVCGRSQEASEAIRPLEQLGGYQAEIGLIETLSKLFEIFQNFIQQNPDGKPSAITLADFLKNLNALNKLISGKYGENTVLVPQKDAWMGELYKSLPISPVELISIEIGMTPLKQPLEKILKIIPEHQILNFALGSQYFGGPEWRRTYQYFVAAARADPIVADLQRAAAWFALVTLVVDAKTANKAIEPVELAELMVIIHRWHQQDGKYISAPVPSELAFNALMRAGQYRTAQLFAAQEVAQSDAGAKGVWQSKADFAGQHLMFGSAAYEAVLSATDAKAGELAKQEISNTIERLNAIR